MFVIYAVFSEFVTVASYNAYVVKGIVLILQLIINLVAGKEESHG